MKCPKCHYLSFEPEPRCRNCGYDLLEPMPDLTMELGRGRPLADILAGMRMVAEGVRTTDAAMALAARHGVELPIAAQMAEVLAGRKTPQDAVADLMLRPQRGEG